MGRWVPTEWTRVDDLGRFKPNRIEIRLMVSPFYEGTKFAVRRGDLCLNTSGNWEWEPLPSERDGAFYARCRFGSLEEAKSTASKAPLL